MTERDRCCDEDYGGSHYHCGGCGAVTGMYGHYTSRIYPVNRGPVTIPGAHCCTAEFEEQVYTVLAAEEAAAYIEGVRRGIPRSTR